MSEDEKRNWLQVNRPCGRCKKYFSYTFGDKKAACPHCDWKLEERKDKKNESERQTGNN